MPLVQPRGQMTCPCCLLSGNSIFEIRQLTSLKHPRNPDIFDQLCETTPRKNYYGCIRCGWILGMDEKEKPQILAKERANRTEVKPGTPQA